MSDLLAEPDEGAVTDGRRQRALRTRQAIVSAAITLQSSADPEAAPSVKAFEIAEKAGVSLRSIFMHFPTNDSLTLAVMDEIESRIVDKIAVSTPVGTFATRLADFIERRISLLEFVAPFRRSANAHAASPAVSARRRQLRKQLRKEVSLVFEPELKVHEDPEVVLNAIAILCESESWDTLRRYYGLSSKAAKNVLRQTTEKLLMA